MKSKLFKNLGKKKHWAKLSAAPPKQKPQKPKPGGLIEIDDTKPLHPVPEAGPWVVLMVEPRMEHKAAAALREAGYAAWFPQTVEEVKAERRGQRVKRKVNRPLFPRYIFAANGEAVERFSWPSRDECRAIAARASVAGFRERIAGHVERVGMLDCDHVSAIVAPSPAGLVEDLSRRQADGEFVRLEVEAAQFGLGVSVRVTDGPFRGFDGIVQATAKNRVSILVSIFGRQTPVELEPQQVEAA